MLTSSSLLLRRRGHGHVVKYLEGVPTPSKLIDHLAGADLHASAELPFYNTVPRYVDVQREQRISQLFFHHVLYPAGGARLPYQAVVVRGGRAVRSSTPRLWQRGGLKSTEAGKAAAVPSSSSPRPRVDPLAVPASQLGSSPSPPSSSSSASATALVEDVPSSAAWARVDPARRPYFAVSLPTASGSPSRYRNTHADNGPTATNPNVPDRVRAARQEAAPPTRAIEDEALKTLRGVVEHYWKGREGGVTAVQRLERLLVSPSAGLLWLSESSDGEVSTPQQQQQQATTRSVWGRVVESVRRTAPTAARPSSSLPVAASWTTFAYVQTRLPPPATVALPVDGERGVLRCRLAGGVEPVVPFAVGRPLMAAPASTDTAATPGDALFSHLTCLTRVHMHITAPADTDAPPSSSAVQQDGTAEAKEARAPAAVSSQSSEPWKLGPDGLDLTVPQRVRTVAEVHPAKARPSRDERSVHRGGRFVLGRGDAETYLLPQRELLITLYVPAHTEKMCAQQNNDRLQRQVRAGRAGGAAMAWPTEHSRMTSSRRARGQYANAASAGETGAALQTVKGSGASLSSSSSSGQLVSRTSHEVRALPGDVVYVPRGWGYDVQRILGTATVHSGQRTHDTAMQHEFRDHRTLSATRGASLPRVGPAHPSATVPARTLAASEEAARAPPLPPCTIESVVVDAFCLHYHPYPELTAAQADVYVAANYVHTGVEQFYEKGGNDVFRAYQ